MFTRLLLFIVALTALAPSSNAFPCLDHPVDSLRVGTGWFGSRSYIEQPDGAGGWHKCGYVDFVADGQQPLTYCLHAMDEQPLLSMELVADQSSSKHCFFLVKAVDDQPLGVLEAKFYYFDTTGFAYEYRALDNTLLLCGSFSNWSFKIDDGFPLGDGFQRQMVTVAQCCFSVATQKLHIKEVDTAFFAGDSSLWMQYLLIKAATFNPKYLSKILWRHG